MIMVIFIVFISTLLFGSVFFRCLVKKIALSAYSLRFNNHFHDLLKVKKEADLTLLLPLPFPQINHTQTDQHQTLADHRSSHLNQQTLLEYLVHGELLIRYRL